MTTTSKAKHRTNRKSKKENHTTGSLSLGLFDRPVCLYREPPPVKASVGQMPALSQNGYGDVVVVPHAPSVQTVHEGRLHFYNQPPESRPPQGPAMCVHCFKSVCTSTTSPALCANCGKRAANFGATPGLKRRLQACCAVIVDGALGTNIGTDSCPPMSVCHKMPFMQCGFEVY